jgi:hypothetical protein
MADEGEMADERQIELETISSIYPELVLDPENRYSASLDIPVIPNDPVPVRFPGSSDGDVIHDPAVPNTETHDLSNLPSLHLQITLPEGYPANAAPVFKLSTNPSWLSQDIITRLEKDGPKLWEEFGKDQVLYAYVDHLETSARDAFGVLEKSQYLEISQDHKISLLDCDLNAKRETFEKETFDCGICLGKLYWPAMITLHSDISQNLRRARSAIECSIVAMYFASSAFKTSTTMLFPRVILLQSNVLHQVAPKIERMLWDHPARVGRSKHNSGPASFSKSLLTLKWSRDL